MNGKSHDVVTLLNTTNEDFEFQYDSSSGNPPYVMPAGKPARFPRFLAQHGLKHFIDHVINLQGGNTSDEMLRRKIAQDVVISEETFQQEREPSEAEVLRAKVDELNKPSELESVLAKYREDKKKPPEEKEIPVKKEIKAEEKEEEEKFEEIEQETKKEPEPAGKPPTKYPTRSDLMNHAKDKLGITIDSKLKAKFDKMNIPTLVKELDYPLKEG